VQTAQLVRKSRSEEPIRRADPKSRFPKKRTRMYGPPAAFHFYKHSIVIDEFFCTGCFRCTNECPIKTVIGAKVVDGKKKAFVKEPDDCIGCMKCFHICQIKAITCRRKPKAFK